MSEASSIREKIEDILMDTYDEDEQASAWGVAFQDEVETPFPATLFGVPVEVQDFQTGPSGAPQCLVAGAGRERWIGVEDLDVEGLPSDLVNVLNLYKAWLSGDY